MIHSLHISNYALISQIDIDFSDGLNIITGETGAGKSIILGALSLLLGARADSKVITDTTRKSIIEVEFYFRDPSFLEPFFKANDLDSDGSVVLMRRELSPGGRSRAFINDTPVNLNQLHDLAIQLVDIHSQHRNLLLGDADYQRNIIDSLADNEALISDYQKAYAAYQKCLKNYTATRDMIRRGRDDADYIAYQLKELDELNIYPGEEAELVSERDSITETSEIKRLITDVLSSVNGEQSALYALDLSSDSLRELSETIPEAEDLASRLDSAISEIRDIVNTVEVYDSQYSYDPERLNDIEERLSKIYSLETKHHVSDSDALVDLRKHLSEQIDILSQGDEIIAKMEADARNAKKDAVILAREISQRRKTCAVNFAKELQEAAAPLGMKNLRCEIEVTSGKLNNYGSDQVEFLFAFNKNSELLPIRQTASGGEISRLMLAIKSIIGQKMQLPTIIFDEIDTGVSGEIASKMGEMMELLSKHIQVIVITHHPQVAAKGRIHYKVYKQDDDKSTNTYIRQLSDDERVEELASMLSGSSVNEAALATAKSLLN